MHQRERVPFYAASDSPESKNLRNEGLQCRNGNAKILRLRTSCFAQDDRC